MKPVILQAPAIHLHIGRNKAGSTTLQDFFLAHRDELEQGGVRYVLFGHLKDQVPGVPGFGHQDELAAYARAHPNKAILVSNEFMFGWPSAYTEGMVEGLKGLEVRVIAYIRPYGSWVCSSYAQDVRNGESRRDFDEYLDWLRPRVSAWPYLEAWGRGLGWHNVRVRSIDEHNTRWDDLIADCLAAIGLEPGLAMKAPPSNPAPHWATVELLRTLVESNQERAWDDAALAVVAPLRDLFEECLTGTPAFDRAVQYLTPPQARELTELYNQDIERIAKHTGVTFGRQPVDDLPQRPFLPAFDRVPAAIRREFSARACAPDFVRRFPRASAVMYSRQG